mmetsp:Transcript_33692/g.55476  ORF Transcript_33692/g.55476 Transcript_33692/m.55476 type:complete len:246 (-) Transcript_33692:11-748(-)
MEALRHWQHLLAIMAANHIQKAIQRCTGTAIPCGGHWRQWPPLAAANAEAFGCCQCNGAIILSTKDKDFWGQLATERGHHCAHVAAVRLGDLTEAPGGRNACGRAECEGQLGRLEHHAENSGGTARAPARLQLAFGQDSRVMQAISQCLTLFPKVSKVLAHDVLLDFEKPMRLLKIIAMLSDLLELSTVISEQGLQRPRRRFDAHRHGARHCSTFTARTACSCPEVTLLNRTRRHTHSTRAPSGL